jgi:hypothetical protein
MSTMRTASSRGRGGSGFNQAVHRRRAPFVDGMLDALLHILDGGVALVPAPAEVLGNAA